MAWLTDWLYRKTITIPATSVDAELSYFPLTLYLDSSNFVFANAQSNGSDIRFTSDAAGTTFLKFERKEHAAGTVNYGDGSSNATSDAYTNKVYTNTGLITTVSYTYNTGNCDNLASLTSVLNAGTTAQINLNDDISSGTNAKTFTTSVAADRWMYMSANGAGTSSFGVLGQLKFTFAGTQRTINEAIANGDIEPLVFVCSPQLTESYCISDVLDLLTDADCASTKAQWAMVMFKTKVEVTAISIYSSVAFTGGSDEFAVKSVAASEVDFSLAAFGNGAIYNIQVPTVSESSDTNIYMWYGNSSAYNTSIEAWQDQKGKQITYNGNAKIVRNSSSDHYASFDGTGDYLALASSSDFAFGTGAYTVEIKAYINSWTTDATLFIVGASGGFQLGRNTATSNWGTCANGVAWKTTYGTLPTTGGWHDLCACRIGSTERLFLDGVQVASTTNAYNYVVGAALIGGNTSSGQINGNVGAIRITKGTGRYSGNYTVPTTYAIDGTDVVLCTNFDTIYDSNYTMVQHLGSTLTDASGSGNSGTATGTSVANTDYGMVRQFNGTSDKILTPLITTTDNLTMTVMAKKVGAGGTDCLFYVGTSGTNGYGLWTNSLEFSLKATSTYADTTVDNSTTPQVVTLKRTSGTWTCFIDGTAYSVTNLSVSTPTVSVYFGATASGDYYDGQLSNARYSVVARSDAWIKAESLAIKNSLLTISAQTIEGGSTPTAKRRFAQII